MQESDLLKGYNMVLYTDNSKMGTEKLAIATDNQATIQALGSSMVKSAVVRQCVNRLTDTRDRCDVTLI